MSDDDKMVILVAGRGEADGTKKEENKVEVTHKAACMSELVKTKLFDDDDERVPEILLDVTKRVLDLVVIFLNKHKDDPMKEIQKPIPTNDLKAIVGEWDANFIDLEEGEIFEVFLAAKYLDIPSLLDLGACKVACMVKGKEPEEIQKLFNIEPDITPEEEKRVRDENPWIFDLSPDDGN